MKELVDMNTLSKRLIIDTATSYLFLALYEGEQVVESYYQAGQNDHSVKIVSEIERMFLSNLWNLSDIDEIIVGIGPGSYTGLRIGVVVAKMLGWNNKIPVKSVSSLALLASSCDDEGLLLAEMDARRGNSFLGVYRNTGKGLEIVKKEELTNLEQYKETLDKSFTVVSFGEPKIGKLLGSSLLKDVPDIHQLNPNYLRKTEAERNLENS